MKNRLLIVIIIVILIIGLFLYLVCSKNRKVKMLEKEVSNIEMPQDIEKIAIKSAIGDSGGNGDYSTCRVILLVKTEITIDELRQKFENMNLKFQNHYKNCENIPIFYITHCESSIFKSSRSFSIEFEELKGINDYRDYYFIEFVE